MVNGTILIADDEDLIRQVLHDTLTEQGYHVEAVATGSQAWSAVQEQVFDLAFVDIRMPGLNGLDLLQKTQAAQIDLPIIIMTGQTTLTNAIEAMKHGAFDYLPKPFDLDDVHALVSHVIETKRLTANTERPLPAIQGRDEQIIGSGAAMQQVYKTIGRIVRSDATVLLQGESGTGKELVAKVIHHYSARWRAPFIGVNCSAIPLDLLESELFGHERGAFTGAVERHAGKFEQAAGGTLFLDEIGDMPPSLQAKLLRVLQEREFTRVGGSQALQADVRIIAATNQDLAAAVKEKRFREDLYFRLRVVPITLPPLRQRREDIPELTAYFLDKITQEVGAAATGITPEAQALLTHYSWPGNVRELENTLLRATVLSPGPLLMPADFSLPQTRAPLPADLAELSFEEVIQRQLTAYLQQPDLLETGDLHAVVISQVEKPLIELVLDHTRGNQLKAAEILGINRNTLRKKMTDLKIAVKK